MGSSFRFGRIAVISIRLYTDVHAVAKIKSNAKVDQPCDINAMRQPGGRLSMARSAA